MKTHDIKILPQYFERIQSGQKMFEVRKNDRDYQVGDELILDEWDPIAEQYTERLMTMHISYVLYGGQCGIAEGYCVLGLMHSGQWADLVENHFAKCIGRPTLAKKPKRTNR
jgi:hypothetical protein